MHAYPALPCASRPRLHRVHPTVCLPPASPPCTSLHRASRLRLLLSLRALYFAPRFSAVTYRYPQAMRLVRERHPDVPLIYYANGGSSYLDLQRDMACDVLSIDWAVMDSLSQLFSCTVCP